MRGKYSREWWGRLSICFNRGREAQGERIGLALVHLPVALRMESHLKEPVLGVVTLATSGADQVAAPGGALAIVVFGHGEGCAAAAGDEEHAQGRFGFRRRCRFGAAFHGKPVLNVTIVSRQDLYVLGDDGRRWR